MASKAPSVPRDLVSTRDSSSQSELQEVSRPASIEPVSVFNQTEQENEEHEELMTEPLRRKSAQEARDKLHENKMPEVVEDDWQEIQRDERIWVHKIRAAIMSYHGNAPPPHKGRGDTGKALSQKDIDEWWRWQKDAQWSVDLILNLPIGALQAEDTAWIMIDELIKSHRYGFIETTIEPDLTTKASERLNQIVDILEGFAIARFNVLENRVKFAELTQILTNPTEWIKRKSANVWTNLEKVGTDTKRNQRDSRTVPAFLRRRLNDDNNLLRKWKRNELTEADFSTYIGSRNGSGDQPAASGSTAAYQASYIIEDGKIVGETEKGDASDREDEEPFEETVEYAIGEDGKAIVEWSDNEDQNNENDGEDDGDDDVQEEDEAEKEGSTS